jgi:hypothetical protein
LGVVLVLFLSFTLFFLQFLRFYNLPEFLQAEWFFRVSMDHAMAIGTDDGHIGRRIDVHFACIFGNGVEMVNLDKIIS